MIRALTVLISLAALFIKDRFSLIYILSITAVSYGLSFTVKKNRFFYCISLLAVLLPLILFKFISGFNYSVIGISYFTLQIIAYFNSIRNEKLNPQKNILKYAMFICYYPHLLQGPIEKAEDFFENTDKSEISSEKIGQGLYRIVFGLFKKYTVAARIAIIINAVTSDLQKYTGLYVLYALLLYSVQLYCDFSGGIDMVIGISSMLGFDMSENFNRPFTSQTVAEFWRRWHITLGTFLKENIYIPLGGNRKGKIRKYVNTLITFTVSGLWHGTQYVIWGLLNGICVCMGNLLKTENRIINRVKVFTVISLMWAFFIYPDSLTAVKMLGSIFTGFSVKGFAEGFFSLGISTVAEYVVLVTAAICVFICDGKKEKIMEAVRKDGSVLTFAMCAMIIAILLFGVYGIGYDVQSFIYSKF